MIRPSRLRVQVPQQPRQHLSSAGIVTRLVQGLDKSNSALQLSQRRRRPSRRLTQIDINERPPQPEHPTPRGRGGPIGRRHHHPNKINRRTLQSPSYIRQHEPVVSPLQPPLNPTPGRMRNPSPTSRKPNTPPPPQPPRPNPLPDPRVGPSSWGHNPDANATH
ncbi:hypothetical protein GCM10010435_64850 [Winogradskya consettensis]|uniref:Uncharacterized protein n=1 Tax=Winogradskya consettensis TaxID=113560 RepID=A0A919VWW2_9ACTN|nr:hypothetical protein Aco04nite_29110 [Actinoplanes consettensis]